MYKNFVGHGFCDKQTPNCVSAPISLILETPARRPAAGRKPRPTWLYYGYRIATVVFAGCDFLTFISNGVLLTIPMISDEKR